MVQVASIHQSHVNIQIKISQTILEKGHHSFWWYEILWPIFKKDLPRNIPAKFGSNWSGSLAEEDV